MSDQKLKSGDTVRLKSGGPVMTVKNLNNFHNWVCTYFDKDGKVQEAAFVTEQLIPSEPSKDYGFV